MRSTKLKGGSLSSTWLFERRSYDGPVKFVRKSVNLNEDREYGYVRWYSQMKKIQRLGALHPELFPKITKASFRDNYAYFDMEYLAGFTDIKSLLRDETLTESQIKKMHDKLWQSFDLVHDYDYTAIPSSMRLYFKEEVKQKLHDAMQNKNFADFANRNSFYYMDDEVFSMDNFIQSLSDYFSNVQLSSEENIHGNPTLENIMYSPSENRIVFIDLYEESIIDSKFLDYAQVLQCSSSGYGIINDGTVYIDGDNEDHLYHISEKTASLKIFNTHFVGELERRKADMKLVRVLEATQFIRMLPFKILAGDLDKAKFFYVHACKLLQDIFDVE
jgi:hypothetical protein